MLPETTVQPLIEVLPTPSVVKLPGAGPVSKLPLVNGAPDTASGASSSPAPISAAPLWRHHRCRAGMQFAVSMA